MAKYQIRDVFGRFVKLIGGVPQTLPRPVVHKDALGRFTSPPKPIPPSSLPGYVSGGGGGFVAPSGGSGGGGYSDPSSFEYMRDNAKDIADELDKPDINEFLAPGYDDEWLAIWNHAPVEDMSEAQIWEMIDIINGLDTMTWEELWDEMYDDFWEWYRENYGSGDGG